MILPSFIMHSTDRACTDFSNMIIVQQELISVKLLDFSILPYNPIA